jgi:hypothetical protein
MTMLLSHTNTYVHVPVTTFMPISNQNARTARIPKLTNLTKTKGRNSS